jgi:hypothetical protein
MGSSAISVLETIIPALAVLAGVWSRDVMVRKKTELYEQRVWLRDKGLEVGGEALAAARDVRSGFERAYEEWRSSGGVERNYRAVDTIEVPLTAFLRVVDVAFVLPVVPIEHVRELREAARNLAVVVRFQSYADERDRARQRFDAATENFSSAVRAGMAA